MAKMQPTTTDGGLLTLGLVSATCVLLNLLTTNIATISYVSSVAVGSTPRVELQKSEEEYRGMSFFGICFCFVVCSFVFDQKKKKTELYFN